MTQQPDLRQDGPHTVASLIAALQAYPPEAKVVLLNADRSPRFLWFDAAGATDSDGVRLVSRKHVGVSPVVILD